MTHYGENSVSTSDSGTAIPTIPTTVSSTSKSVSFGTFVSVSDWINGYLAAVHQTTTWIKQWQRLSLLTAFSKGETLNAEWHAMEQSTETDTAPFLSEQATLIDNQLEENARQLSAAMQQIFDTQLFWVGHLVKEVTVPPTHKDKPISAAAQRATWESVQDAYLAMSRLWIDLAKAVNPPN